MLLAEVKCLSKDSYITQATMTPSLATDVNWCWLSPVKHASMTDNAVNSEQKLRNLLWRELVATKCTDARLYTARAETN